MNPVNSNTTKTKKVHLSPNLCH